MFLRGFVFRVIIPLDLVKPSSLVVFDSVLLVENLDGICLVRQIRFQWDDVFDNHICWRLQTSLKLGDMKHIMNPPIASLATPLDKMLAHTCR
jgi:hypothetical protein